MNANYKMTYKMKVADQPKYLRPRPELKRPTRLECPHCANSGHGHRHSIISSALASKVGATARVIRSGQYQILDVP